MKVNQATHPVGMMCRLLQVSRSGYYAWLDRPMCARKRADLALTGKIAAIHRFSRETYGSPMIHAELADAQGIHVGRKRVARLMRAAGLRGATLRKFVVTTQRADQSSEVTDLVERRFYAERPNRLWVADATYIPTWSGFLYLPPAAAGCTAGKIDEHREDESHRLRRQPVHGSGAAPEEDRAPLSGGVNRPESEVGDHSRIPLVHFRLFEQLKRRNVFRVAALYLVQRPLDFLEARLLSQRVEPRVYLQIR